MSLPNVHLAAIDAEKVRDYLLSAEHPVGRFKARFFGALGYTRDDWPQLQRDLLAVAQSGAAKLGRPNAYGQKYEVRGKQSAPSGVFDRRSDSLDRTEGRKYPAVRDRVPGGEAMTFKELDTLVLDRDVPEHGLRRGDLGAVVQVHQPDGLEVEFVTASDRTQALVTLTERDVRAVGEEDLISVRPLKQGAAQQALAGGRRHAPPLNR